MKRTRIALAALLAIGLIPIGVAALTSSNPHVPKTQDPISQVPNTQSRAHYVGNIWLTLSNWGFFGNDGDLGTDPNHPNGPGINYPAAQFPANGQQEYLFQGALWVGAFKRGWEEPRVSVGADGWEHINETYPAAGAAGNIIERSTINGDPGAVSQEDIICFFSDTVTNQTFVPPDPTNGPHLPMGVSVEERSYAWSYAYAQDFILFDFLIKNMGYPEPNDTLFDVYMALYMDHDVYHMSEDASAGAQDDVTGFKRYYVSPTGDSSVINVAWIADIDGNTEGGAWADGNVRHVTGVRVVRAPGGGDVENLSFTYNWYISNTTESFDWGPSKVSNSFTPWGFGWDGTPEGDTRKYFLMVNGEFDYDQVYTWGEHNGYPAPGYVPSEWVDPISAGVPDPRDLANGYDTRYLLSFGPIGNDSIFDVNAPRLDGNGTEPRWRKFIPPYTGDTTEIVYITLAYVGGEYFHLNPAFDTSDVSVASHYYDANNRSFDDLAYNANWAALVFDNNGDNIPDFAGPPPPNSPDLMFQTSEGAVTVMWNARPEDPQYYDPFSYKQDFEGYRVYVSSTGRASEFSLLASFDEIDYDSFFVDPQGNYTRWPGDSTTVVPLPRADLLARLGLTDPTDDDLAALGWYPHDWNRGMGARIDSYWDGAYNLGEFFVDNPGGTLGVWDPGEYFVDGMYSYTVTNLLPKQGKYFAVTAFDFGDPASGTDPLESSVLLNFTFVVPGATGVANQKVVVIPNPYRADAAYNDPDVWGPAPWEDPDQSGWSESDRRLRFSNLPGPCTIRIYTLDGDLVDTVVGDGGPYADWDLISRNAQAIVSGVYLFSVEPAGGGDVQIGKFVVIK